jgi:prepilin signal peptidase PulO-like enzyme (type II secretory pathway)
MLLLFRILVGVLVGVVVCASLDRLITILIRTMDSIGRAHYRTLRICKSCEAIAPRKLILQGLDPLSKKTNTCPECGQILIAPHVFRSRYMLIFGAVSGVLCGLRFESFGFLVTSVLFLCGVCAVGVVDFTRQEVPDSILLYLLLVGILSFFTIPELGWVDRLVGFFGMSMILFFVTLIAHHAFDGGEIRFAAVGGMVLGWKLSILVLLIAVALGGAWALIALAQKRKGKTLLLDRFSFGPCLSLGMIAALFCGSGIVELYTQLLFG